MERTCFCLAFCLAALSPAAHADPWDKRTLVAFSEPVEVPGYILQPGRYLMKVTSSQVDRSIVQFTNERQNHVYATAEVVPAYRSQATDETVITFYQVPVGQPQPMRFWYYPGDLYGQELVYSKEHLAQIAAVDHSISLHAPNTSGLNTSAPNTYAVSPVVEASPVSESATLTTLEPPPETNRAAEAESAEHSSPASNPVKEESIFAKISHAMAKLSQADDNLPLIALLGIVSVGGAITARKFRGS